MNPGVRAIRRPYLTAVAAVAVAVAWAWPGPALAADAVAADALAAAVEPLPVTAPLLDPAKVELGRRLFHDPRLSGNQTVSCAHCHDLVAKAGTDGLPKSRRIDDGFDDINTLTVFNSAYNRMLMWNGRWRTLEEQAEGVMNNPRHMGGPWEVVLPRIEADADFAARFKASYGQVTREAVKEALATFERTLVTPNAPFDRHLRGDANALDEDQKSGWNLFQSYGCIACHQGQNLGGNLFAKLGVFKDYFAGRKDLTEADLGRYAVTKQDSDKHVFRVPSLRNVARTGPWFHDGSQATLDDAVRTMAKHQLGRKLPDEDVRLIVHFLEGLTGEWQGKPL